MSFLYELHVHTSEVSKCATSGAAEQMRRFAHYGYTGVCVTDHFLNGNTSAPKTAPWEERIRYFCRGYRAARDEGEKLGLDVFFGWEYSYHGTDFLTYGLDENWLLAHPGILDLSVSAYCDFVRAEGGFVVQAHPFREAGYIEMIRLLPRKVDAVEALNACRTDFENERAAEYARNYGLALSAGSDIHHPQARLCAVSAKHRVKDLAELLSLIRDGNVGLETVYDGRPDGLCI